MSTLSKEHFDEQLGLLDKRFTGLEAGQTSLEIRFNGVEGRLTTIEGSLTTIEDRLSDHEERFQRIETTLEVLVQSVDRFSKIYIAMSEEFAVMRQHLRDVETRVEKLELKLKTT